MKFLKSTLKKIKKKFKRKKNSSRNAVMASSVVVVNPEGSKKETNVLDVNLLDDSASKSDKKKVRQYTKVAVTCILILTAIWVTWSYVLGSYCVVVLGTTEVLQDLSKDVCTSIIAVMLGYFLKAYFESHSQANHELDLMKVQSSTQTTSLNNSCNDDEEAVG